MKIFTIAALAATFIATQSVAEAHEFKAGDLVIDHPMAFETAKTAMSGGGFFSVTNNGTETDRLIGVEADFPRVEVHDTEMTDGVARMFHVEGIDIPAGETITLAPGGMHVMFMGLNGDPLEVGEEIPAKLLFEKAGEVEVVFNVEARSDEGMDHSAHGATN